MWIPLALLLAAGMATGEERARTAKLEALTLKEPRPFLWRLEGERTPAATQSALRGTIARRRVLFVDVDGDGRFDEPDVDGWLIEPMLYLVPFRKPLVVEASLVEVRIDAKGRTAEWRATQIDAPRDHRYTLADVNELRMRNGLPPVAYSAELSEGCRSHCAYMDRHGITHYEKKGKPGYTPEGAQAGRNGNIATTDDLDRVARFAYATFFHRRTLMEPHTYEIGLGASDKHVCLDGLSHMRNAVPWQYPIIVPAPGTEAQPRALNDEVPPPVPSGSSAGFPITLRWFGATKFRNVKATLRPRRKKPVGAYVSWPGKPAHASIPHNQYTICIIPKRMLEAGTEYTVEVAAEIDGKPYEKSFTFRTEGVRKR